MSSFDYKKALKDIPHKPGVYQYFDVDDTLIYIGKAKDLRLFDITNVEQP